MKRLRLDIIRVSYQKEIWILGKPLVTSYIIIFGQWTALYEISDRHHYPTPALDILPHKNVVTSPWKWLHKMMLLMEIKHFTCTLLNIHQAWKLTLGQLDYLIYSVDISKFYPIVLATAFRRNFLTQMRTEFASPRLKKKTSHRKLHKTESVLLWPLVINFSRSDRSRMNKSWATNPDRCPQTEYQPLFRPVSQGYAATLVIDRSGIFAGRDSGFNHLRVDGLIVYPNRTSIDGRIYDK